MVNERLEIGLVDYSRQADMDDALYGARTYGRSTPDHSIHIIVGCGGIGFWLGTMLAMMGHKNFILIDGDKISETNLNRLPVPQAWVGLNKAFALKRIIRTLRPWTVVTPLASHLTDDTLEPVLFKIIEKGSNLATIENTYHHNTLYIWDTTDDARIQAQLSEFISEFKERKRCCYRKIGYEGFNMGIYKNYDVWFDPETYQPGYRTSSANALSSVVSASLGIVSMFKNLPDSEINLIDIIEKGDTNGQTEQVSQSDQSTESGVL